MTWFAPPIWISVASVEPLCAVYMRSPTVSWSSWLSPSNCLQDMAFSCDTESWVTPKLLNELSKNSPTPTNASPPIRSRHAPPRRPTIKMNMSPTPILVAGLVRGGALPPDWLGGVCRCSLDFRLIKSVATRDLAPSPAVFWRSAGSSRLVVGRPRGSISLA